MARMRTQASGFLMQQAEGIPFVQPLGKLMINFGGIEFYSYIWITELSRDEILLDMAVDLNFARRVDLIMELLDRERMPRRWKSTSADLWRSAKRLSEVRNKIAHSPIAFAGTQPPFDGPPDVVGIPNLRYLKRKHGRALPITPLTDVLQAVDEVANVGLKLQECLEQFRARLTARSAKKGHMSPRQKKQQGREETG